MWSLNFTSSVGFQASKTNIFFGKLTIGLVWKSFLGRNNSLESTPVFWFFNNHLYGPEESIKKVESFD